MIEMKLILKIIFWMSISFIGTCIFVGLLGLVLPIEIIDDKIDHLYFNIRFYGFPISIILTLTGTIKPTDKLGLIIGKILATIGGSIVSIFIGFVLLFTGMCGWLTDDILFENKSDTSTKIEVRHYDCGATDSDRPNLKTYKVVSLTKYFIWRTRVDTNDINKDEWTRIRMKEE